MDKRFLSNNSIREFKRKRKSSVQVYRFEESCIDEDIKPFKRLITDDEYDTFTESPEYETSTNGYLSSDDSEFKYKQELSEIKMEPKINNSPLLHTKTKRTNSFLSQTYVNDDYSDLGVFGGGKSYNKSKPSPYEDYFVSAEQDTFRVDMSRFQCFNTSAPQGGNSLLHHHHSDFKSSVLDSPAYKVPPLSSSSSMTAALTTGTTMTTPPRMQNQRRNRSHIYKPHRHNKSVSVSHVPCKGPACTSQICCAHFCSQKCYDNQKWPIGTGGAFKTSLPDYDSCGQPEINVTDYGLPYADHTYCRDHKGVYFTADSNVDRPPYFELVEALFYDEKEARIKNPVPAPNPNGDPISSNGYSSQATRRGRPKRSNVVGLLNSYIFHPSSEVIYTPFVFKEPVVEADRYSNEIKSQEPIIHALRQCSNLYKDVRPDIPKEVLYGGAGGGLNSIIASGNNHGNRSREMLDHPHHHLHNHQQQQYQLHHNHHNNNRHLHHNHAQSIEDLVKSECTTDLIDDLFGSTVDDFPFK